MLWFTLLDQQRSTGSHWIISSGLWSDSLEEVDVVPHHVVRGHDQVVFLHLVLQPADDSNVSHVSHVSNISHVSTESDRLEQLQGGEGGPYRSLSVGGPV